MFANSVNKSTDNVTGLLDGENAIKQQIEIQLLEGCRCIQDIHIIEFDTLPCKCYIKLKGGKFSNRLFSQKEGWGHQQGRPF